LTQAGKGEQRPGHNGQGPGPSGGLNDFAGRQTQGDEEDDPEYGPAHLMYKNLGADPGNQKKKDQSQAQG
jgi:hypothetical protein